VLSCVFHFANGIWTGGITWGIWTSRAAQRRASYVVSVFGVLLAIVAMSALVGMARVDVDQARKIEDRMQRAREFIQGEVPEPAEVGGAAAGSSGSSGAGSSEAGPSGAEHPTAEQAVAGPSPLGSK
jgi:succinate dehydrogenase / fumarate reductase cytochrome b subunit